MISEPHLQRKKRVDGFPTSKPSMEPPMQRKKRSESTSPARQAMEPELQRKKKSIFPYKRTEPIAAQTSLGGNLQDDYMLLGDQSKFNDNVKYHIRPQLTNGHFPDRRAPGSASVASHADLKDHVTNDRPHDISKLPQASAALQSKSKPKDRGPPPTVVVNTGKPTRTEGTKSSLELDLGKKRSHGQHVETHYDHHDHHQKGILRKSAATQSTPRLANESAADAVYSQQQKQDTHLKLRNGVSSKTASSTSGKSLPHEGHPQGIVAEKKVQVEVKQPTTSKADGEKKHPAASKADNYASKADNYDRGPNYPIKYRLGIAPHLSTNSVRFSEYQKEFKWRDPIKASPLLSAETIVYKSHPDLTLLQSTSHMMASSEYQAQFKAKTPQEEPSQKSIQPANEKVASASKKPKIRRSSSMKELSAHANSRDSASMVSTSVGQSALENGQDMKHNGPPKKRYQSEYTRNFLAPWNYLYEEGAWKKVHSEVDTTEAESRPVRSSSASSWYAEVLELRHFADEYRKRAQGTHFSHEHLAQLYAKNAELWDIVSNSSSILSSRSADSRDRVEEPSAAQKASKKSEPNSVPVDSVAARSGSTTQVGKISFEEKENAFHSGKKAFYKGHRFTKTEPVSQSKGFLTSTENLIVDDDERDDATLNSSDASSEGTLYSGRDQERDFAGIKEKAKAHRRTYTSSNDKTSQLSRTNSLQKTLNQPQPTIMSHGVQTKDSHILQNRHRQEYGELRKESQPPALECEDKAVQIKEEDLMSVSSTSSLASSCSLASEVLERARNRRDRFWN